MNYNKIDFLVEDLPALPEIISLLMIEFNAEDPSFLNIERLIYKDPFLTTKVLNISNSAMFNLFRKVNNIGDALQVVGYKKLTNLVLMANLSHSFKVDDKIDLFAFWQYSLNVSNLSFEFAKKANLDTATALTIGLIHGIGELILHMKLKVQMESINKECNFLSNERVVRERNTLGFCYLDVSREFIKKNKFSSLITDTIKDQANLSFANSGFDNYSKLSLVIYLATWRARNHLNADKDNGLSDFQRDIIKYLDMTEEDIFTQDETFWASKEDVALIV